MDGFAAEISFTLWAAAGAGIFSSSLSLVLLGGSATEV
jgi:hypothetical protein